LCARPQRAWVGPIAEATAHAGLYEKVMLTIHKVFGPAVLSGLFGAPTWCWPISGGRTSVLVRSAVAVGLSSLVVSALVDAAAPIETGATARSGAAPVWWSLGNFVSPGLARSDLPARVHVELAQCLARTRQLVPTARSPRTVDETSSADSSAVRGRR